MDWFLVKPLKTDASGEFGEITKTVFSSIIVLPIETAIKKYPLLVSMRWPCVMRSVGMSKFIFQILLNGFLLQEVVCLIFLAPIAS